MAERRNLLEIDGDRLWSALEASAEIGPGKAGGLRRLALDDSDKQMRDLFVSWCEQAGCAVTVRASRQHLPPPPGWRRACRPW